MGSKPVSKICVFCGSSNRVSEQFTKLAERAGALFGEYGWHLIYGGGRAGLMGTLADSALASGAQVTGIIPEFLVEREVAHRNLSKLHITKTMHERQAKMMELAEGFVILPGGLGTLAEFFEVLTWKGLGQHEKPVVLLNHKQYWQPVLAMLSDANKNGFFYRQQNEFLKVVEKTKDIPSAFTAY